MEEEKYADEPGNPVPEDFAVFYQREYASVVRLTLALTGRRDLAEEFAQDAFVAAHGRWERIGSYEAPEAWVRRVATNRCISAFRKRRSELRALARLGRRPSPTVGLPEPDAELWTALRSLPARQAQVLALMFIDDRSTSEVARLLEISEDTVRTHVRRGRRALARRLGLGEEH